MNTYIGIRYRLQTLLVVPNLSDEPTFVAFRGPSIGTGKSYSNRPDLTDHRKLFAAWPVDCTKVMDECYGILTARNLGNQDVGCNMYRKSRSEP